MSALCGRVDELLTAPVAATMFVLANRDGLDPHHLAQPAAVSAYASCATAELNPWTGEAADNRATFLAAAVPLRPLVEAVAADPRNAWWSAPLDRTAQLHLVGGESRDADPMRIAVPTGSVGHWEVYAQKPEGFIVTSTELAVPPHERIRSGAHAALEHGSGDWHPTYPVRQTRLEVAAEARIYEVDSAADWHQLALRYGDPGTHPGSDAHLRATSGLDNGLCPTWSAVAADYDGVHLTFAGLLTGLYAPVVTEGVTTTLWSWQWESTYWLRSVFTTASALPELSDG